MRNNNLAKIAKWAVYIVAGLLAVVFLINFMSGHKVQSWITKHQISQNYDVTTTANGAAKLLVKPSALPQTQNDRMNAPTADLLPQEWASDPLQSPSAKAVEVAPADKKALVGATTQFLSVWETFRPWNDASYAAWKAKVSPYVSSEGGDVIARRDSVQPQTICPDPGCPTGSTFLGIAPLSYTVRSYDGNSAYVTVNGFVRYQVTLSGKKQEVVRQYGLLFTNNNGRWLVSRAASETTAAS
jgi:hypothetical protein